MNCADAELRIFARFDREAISDPAAAEHARTCPACRERQAGIELLAAAIDDWRDTVPTVDFTDDILSRQSVGSVPQYDLRSLPAAAVQTGRAVSSEVGRSPRSASRAVLRARGALCVACAGLAALVAISWLMPPDAGTRNSRPAIVQAPQPRHGKTEPPRPSAGYGGLSERALDVLDELALLVMPGATSAPTSDPGKTGPAGLIDGLQDQLRPIQNSLDDTFDFLWAVGEAAENSST